MDFQQVDMVTSHGDKYGQGFLENVPNWQALRYFANELPDDCNCPHAYRKFVPEESYLTAWVADKAIKYLEGRAGQDDPFFAFVSFPDPHHPFSSPGKYWNIYVPDQISVDLPYSAHKSPNGLMEHASANWREGKVPAIPHAVPCR